MSFEALDSHRWPELAAVIPLPWPAVAAELDLRWHAANHEHKGHSLPSVRDLANRWGWDRSKVHRLLTDERRWTDKYTRQGWRVRQPRDSGETDVRQPARFAAEDSPNMRQPRDSGETDVRLTRDHLVSPTTPRHHDTNQSPDEKHMGPMDPITPETADDRPNPDPDRRSEPPNSQPPNGESNTRNSAIDNQPANPGVPTEPRRPAESVPTNDGTSQPANPVTLPKWSAKLDTKPHPKAEMVAAIVQCVGEVRQKLPNPERCGTDAKPLFALWRAIGCPPPAEFAAEFVAVAKWARESKDKLAAHDIRAESWPEGTDRHRSIDTLARQDRWSLRLDAAQEWADKQAKAANGEQVTLPDTMPADSHEDAILLGDLCDRGDEIKTGDEARTLRLKRMMRVLGGREQIRARRRNLDSYFAKWNVAYPQVLSSIAHDLAKPVAHE